MSPGKPKPGYYITINEAARRLRCKPRMLSEAIYRGELPAFRPNRHRILIRWEKVKEWIESHPVVPAAEEDAGNSKGAVVDDGQTERFQAQPDPEARLNLDFAALASRTPYTAAELEHVSRILTPVIGSTQEREELLLGIARAAQASGRSLVDVVADIRHAAAFLPDSHQRQDGGRAATHEPNSADHYPAQPDPKSLEELQAMLQPAHDRIRVALERGESAARKRQSAIAELGEAMTESGEANRQLQQIRLAIAHLGAAGK